MGTRLLLVVSFAFACLWTGNVETYKPRTEDNEKVETYTPLIEGDMAVPTFSDSGSQVGFAYLKDKARLWHGGRVNYFFQEDEFTVYDDDDQIVYDEDGQIKTEVDSQFSPKEKKVIKEALRHIEDNVPCLNFR